MSDKTSDKLLLSCPFCGGEVELKEFYESCDGKGDRHAKITCGKCEKAMYLTFDEFYDAQKEFGYTGGYYSQNKAFWNGMHQKLIDKWNTRTPVDKVIERLEESKKNICGRYNHETPLLEKPSCKIAFNNGIERAISIVKESM